jgi:hypothetical protein
VLKLCENDWLRFHPYPCRAPYPWVLSPSQFQRKRDHQGLVTDWAFHMGANSLPYFAREASSFSPASHLPPLLEAGDGAILEFPLRHCLSARVLTGQSKRAWGLGVYTTITVIMFTNISRALSLTYFHMYLTSSNPSNNSTCGYAHFTEAETEAYTGQVTVQSDTVGRGWAGVEAQALQTPGFMFCKCVTSQNSQYLCGRGQAKVQERSWALLALLVC